ncbi:hypothetical protein LEP1GSC051_0445 [Leptospira sp. P2653]|nr:hypothetical protein LEP1GSC051_0445 [Leptospira sp. P2653]
MNLLFTEKLKESLDAANQNSVNRPYSERLQKIDWDTHADCAMRIKLRSIPKRKYRVVCFIYPEIPIHKIFPNLPSINFRLIKN